MKALRILYVGALNGTCLDRANAYRRLGHAVYHIDARAMLPSSIWVDRATWRLGGEIFAPWVRQGLTYAVSNRKFDLCHVDNGEWASPSVVQRLRDYASLVINYNIDDPFGKRDHQRFSAYRKALKHYDLVAVVRDENLSEAYALGARNAVRVWRSADEISHAPHALSAEDHRLWDCDALFLGTWMPERGPFLLELAQRGVPLTIRGANWHRAREWPELRAYWKGGAINGDDYAKAIQCARINLGLLSKGNRDLHTTRSLEVPALGALFCAERTKEHTMMYRENEEAVFWSDAAECADTCKRILANEAVRRDIAARGHIRFKANGHMNERVMAQLLMAADPSVGRSLSAR